MFGQIEWNFRTGLMLIAALAAVFAGLWLLFGFLRLFIRKQKGPGVYLFIRGLQWPATWAVILMVIRIAFPLWIIHEEITGLFGQIIAILLIADISWLLIKMMYALTAFILQQYDITAADNLAARKIYTQLKVLNRIVFCLIIFLGAASILITFPGVRQLGASLIASAGVLGIVLGFAAQRTIHTFFTGIQIALTQPIRLDDVVIVEGEWGRIEEITLTYVVVRIWDLRRLILPITYFIEKPFQNWTRSSADILGTVYLYADYTIPVQALREELCRITEKHELWDKKVCGLQVTNTTEKTVELRALVSAADASKAWTLRCDVREKMLQFIQEKYPQSLPRFCADLQQQINENSQ